MIHQDNLICQIRKIPLLEADGIVLMEDKEVVETFYFNFVFSIQVSVACTETAKRL